MSHSKVLAGAISALALLGVSACGQLSPSEQAQAPVENAVDEDTASPTPSLELSDTPGLSLENPLPFGSGVSSDGWTISVIEVEFDATDAILAVSSFNTKPDKGTNYVMVTVEASYDGPYIYRPSEAIKLTTWSKGEERFNYCGQIPNDFAAYETIRTGETIIGNICAQVPAGEVRATVLEVTNLKTGEDIRTHYVALYSAG